MIVRPDLTERSGPDAALTAYVADILPNADTVLASLGGDLEQYERLMRDDTVSASLQQRRDAVIAREWTVEPGGSKRLDKQAADFLREQIAGQAWDEKCRKMLAGLLYGYSVAECLWAVDGSRVILADLKVRRARRFAFGPDGELMLWRLGGYETMPDRKFWVFTCGADDDETPYGRGLGHTLWWPVYLKRNGAKFWSVYLDRFGSPAVRTTYPSGASDDEKAKALAIARALRSEAAVALPQGFEIQLLEAAARGQGSHEAYVRYWDETIIRVILSQTGTSTPGQYVGTAQAHAKVRLDVVRADADMLCASFNNSVARWLTEWNFPGAAVPRVWRVIEDEEAQKTAAERDKDLYDMGLELTDEALAERYSGTWRRRAAAAESPKTAKPEPATATGAQFAEGEDEDDPELLAGHLDSLAAGEMQAVIGQVRDLLDQCASLEEAADKLLTLYPGMDMGRIGQLFGSAMALSTLQGMDAQNEG